ncbi:hypothetical protein M4D81_18800 [Paenibacillus sp. p3-SID867]|uniref:hypothetical protein n=1 Tax=Paenibacillus sp. p3-SID867 TaxID=2916363 RepID=UPI0021A7E620|nr:hypothetical protein [Paenibacillus sp. p3-SID867]MCT1401082.1 hypothetical protein [Paenibacillus sp. p3-SID867]
MINEYIEYTNVMRGVSGWDLGLEKPNVFENSNLETFLNINGKGKKFVILRREFAVGRIRHFMFRLHLKTCRGFMVHLDCKARRVRQVLSDRLDCKVYEEKWDLPGLREIQEFPALQDHQELREFQEFLPPLDHPDPKGFQVLPDHQESLLRISAFKTFVRSFKG